MTAYLGCRLWKIEESMAHTKAIVYGYVCGGKQNDKNYDAPRLCPQKLSVLKAMLKEVTRDFL